MIGGWIGRGRGLVAILCVLGLSGPAAGTAFAGTKQPGPEKVLVLADLGFPGTSPTFRATGGSMLTVHFVDSEHLLVTFSTRGLVPRVPNDPPEDDDRIVAGELVEISTGKVLAQTEWHLHDHGRYLWNLGEGRFLLRIADGLSTFSPMVNLAGGRSFLRTSFAHRQGSIEAVFVSLDGRLVTVETKARVPGMKVDMGDAGTKPPVTIDFYRLTGDGAPESPAVGEDAGAIHATSAVVLPLDADGFLRSTAKGRGRWAVAYKSFNGKEIPLAPVDSQCPPTLIRVGGAQLVAVTCRGLSTASVQLIAYDFDKHDLWEEPLDVTPLPPAFVMAPQAGRFAMSRINSIETQAEFLLSPDTQATQDVRVYQTQTGDLLLKVKCDPVYRTAENFDLSADGTKVAVVREDAIEVFALPKLTSDDRKDLALLEKAMPPVTAGKIDLKGLVEDSPPPDPTQVPLVVQNGDAQMGRKAPTLLNPGEKPEFEKKE